MKAFYKYVLALAAAPLLGACSADEGREPGTDPNPAVTLYTYAPTEANSNPDNDIRVRFVVNNKTSQVKYLAVLSSEIADLSDSALLQKVESEGTAINNIQAEGFADITLKDLHGAYTVAAVANGTKLGNRVTFTGLDWNVVTPGTFLFKNSNVPIESTECSLEVCTTDDTLYRINGVFGEGTAVKMYMLDLEGTDDGGTYRFFRVKDTATPWTYGNYGTLSFSDVGYYYNNAAYITSGGYESGIYEDGYAFFCLQWFVSAGRVGDIAYSYFVPND